MTSPAVPIVSGQVLTGSLFNGTQSERFRKVTLTTSELQQLRILDPRHTFDADGRLLRLGLQAYASFEHHIPPVTALRYSVTFRTLR
jgi:hypothetical protein